MLSVRPIAILLGFGLVSVSSQALADPLLVSEASATYDLGIGGFGHGPSSQQMDNETSAASVSIADASGGSSASGSARAQTSFGVLKAFAATGASTLPTLNDIPQVSTMAYSEFDDLITINSDSLPLGTPVSLSGTVNLHGTFSEFGSVASAGTAQVGLRLGNQLLSPPEFICNSAANCINTNADFTGMLTVDADVGSTLVLIGSLNITQGSEATGPVFSTSGTSNFFDTAGFFLSSNTPGVTLNSASGALYQPVSDATPESSSLILMLAGLSLFLLLAPKAITRRDA